MHVITTTPIALSRNVIRVQSSGFIMVPESSSSVPQTGSGDLPLSSSSSGTTVTISVQAASIDQGRRLALIEAEQHFSTTGDSNPLHILAEGFSNGTYQAVIGFQNAGASSGGVSVPTGGSQMGNPTPPVKASSQPSASSWVLVIPVEIVHGTPQWGRQSAWCRQWVAPVRRPGTRFVSIMGDYDDHRKLTEAMLTAPDSAETAAAALSLGRKYGASSVALIQLDESGVLKAWLWRRGMDPEASDDDVAGSDAKTSALDMLASMVSPDEQDTSQPDPGLTPQGNQPYEGMDSSGIDSVPATAQADTQSDEINIEDHPEYAEPGQYGFAIVMASTNTAAIAAVAAHVRALPGLRIVGSEVDDNGLEIDGSIAGDQNTVVAALARVGITVTSVTQP